MAVNGWGTGWRALLLMCGSWVALGIAPAAARDLAARDFPASSALDASADDTADDRDTVTFRVGAGRLQRVLRDAMAQTRDSTPDWLRYRSGIELVESSMAAGPGDLCLVLQEGRPDGTDLLTARYTLHDRGRFRTFAGAGLNPTVYFHDDPNEPGPSRLDRRHRDSAFGAAAEFGAELRMSPRVQLSAELRWAELDDRAIVLRTERGPVAAESLTLGLAVGYRFR